MRVPADAKAVIVAQNLVAARYVQLAPLYRPGEPRLADGAVIPQQRTAVPIEWDEVKTQLSRLATELGPDSTLSSSSAGRFIESTANAMEGNGDKLRQTFAQLSQLARILSDGSGDVVATIENLQTFVTALRDSSDDIVLFEDRLATFSTVLATAEAISMRRCQSSRWPSARCSDSSRVPGTRPPSRSSGSRTATQVLADHRMDVENILHVAPTAFANAYNILNPNLPGGHGHDSSSPTSPTPSRSSAGRSAASPTSPRPRPESSVRSTSARRCGCSTSTSCRQPPLNPYLMPRRRARQRCATPIPRSLRVVPAEHRCRQSSRPRCRHTPDSGDVPPPPGFPPAAAPAEPPPPASLPDVLLPAEAATSGGAATRTAAVRRDTSHRDHAHSPTDRRRPASASLSRRPPAGSAASTRCRSPVPSQVVRERRCTTSRSPMSVPWSRIRR